MCYFNQLKLYFTLPMLNIIEIILIIEIIRIKIIEMSAFFGKLKRKRIYLISRKSLIHGQEYIYQENRSFSTLF